MRLIIAIVLLIVFMECPVFAKKQPIPKQYDFSTSAGHYQWYQDLRDYIKEKGGLGCTSGVVLEISKDGTFSVNPNFQNLSKGTATLSKQGTVTLEGGQVILGSEADCLDSLKNKKFPLPDNFPGDKATFPIRPASQGPMTQEELDKLFSEMPLKNNDVVIPVKKVE